MRFWIGMTISAFALYVAFSRVDPGEARDAFRDAQYVWLIPAIAFAISSLIARTFRWSALLHPAGIGFRHLFGIQMVGYTVTTVLPFRLGDVVRVFLVGGLYGIRKVRTAATIVVERVLDVLTVLIILMALLPFVSISDRVKLVMWIGSAVIASLVTVILALWFLRYRALGALERGFRWLPKAWSARVTQHAGSVIDGLAVLSSPRMTIGVLGWTVATWLCGGGMMWVMLVAFGLPSSPAVAFFLLAMSALSMVIPSSPGFVGVYHALLIETLVTVFDAPSGAAASYAVMTHLLLFVPTVLFGVAYMLKEREIWEQLLRFRRERRREQDPHASAP
ncbi:MAG TPA: lysylphosphatidylglycerol synthase transmembrane domain-containing protein [Thermomicrobiales bacterium]|nr:lysylphosphatidylglycerol synthase transmembrane domain-containing protein [Thermomicrobiales bacterium]